ncbi:MAG: hypothetical protein ACREM3_11095 [Candidatus Rokuibacteriota bacterium]
MTVWDLVTWLAIAVLGPGALIVFVAFLRDLARPGSGERRGGPARPAPEAERADLG